MAFNFPNGATNGQLYTADNGTVYVFNGIGWVVQASINNYAITGSNTFIGDQIINGSINVSNGITGSTDFNTIQNKPTLISGSSQLTSSFDTIYEIVGRGIISSSSQLTSSFDDRYTLSGSGVVTSPNVLSIETITSASYAELTPVSGTLYIIIG